MKNATESLSLIAGQHSLEIEYHSTVSECQVKLDEQIFYRIVENIFSNAIRYANSKVSFLYTFIDDVLTITITDAAKDFQRQCSAKRIPFFILRIKRVNIWDWDWLQAVSLARNTADV